MAPDISGHSIVVAGVIDQNIVGNRCVANGLPRFAIDTELASFPGDLRFRPTDFILDGVLEADFPLVVEFIEVAKDFDQGLKKIRFSAAVFADEHIDEACAIEAQREAFEVFVLADEYRFQAHSNPVTLAPLRRQAVRLPCRW